MNPTRHPHTWPCCQLTLPARIDNADAIHAHRQHHKALDDGAHVTVVRIDTATDTERRLNNLEAWAISAGYQPDNPTIANKNSLATKAYGANK